METTQAVREMIRPWLIGNPEQDAKRMQRKFRMLGISLADWRVIVAECMA